MRSIPARSVDGGVAQPASATRMLHATYRCTRVRSTIASSSALPSSPDGRNLIGACQSAQRDRCAQRAGALVAHGDADRRARVAAHDPFAPDAIVGDVVVGPERDARVLVRLAFELADVVAKLAALERHAGGKLELGANAAYGL